MEPFSLAIALGALFLWAWAILRLLLHKRDPTATLAWLLFVTMAPYFGPLFFLIFGPQRLERKAIKRRKRTPDAGVGESTEPTPQALQSRDSNLLALASRVSVHAPTAGNYIHLISTPSAALEAMREAVRSAERFIHLEYYIISTDEVTEALFDDLIAARSRGVEVRILYDSFGSLSLKRLSLRRLEKAGIKVAGFLPFSLLPQHINPHFRNHRKILLVDGKLGFTGGANIGKEYLGRGGRHQWRDLVLEVRGPVCTQLGDVFAHDWAFTTRETLPPAFFPPQGEQGNTVTQVMESGPDSPFQAFHKMLFLAINSAEKELLLTTPYFIPDPAISASLIVASLRGVSVELLLPAKSDAPLVQWASRSFYDELLEAGVRIFHYQPTILHSKMMVVDRRWSMFGSANMDIRSFRLNFELNLLCFGEEVAHEAVQRFVEDKRQSRALSKDAFARRPLANRLTENACRLLSPIL